MSINNKINSVKEQAEAHYRNGEFYCSEAIVSAIRTHIAPEMPEEMIALASGFPVGIGGSQCVCGAVSGGVLALGYFFGRTQASDSKVDKTMALANELQESFKKNHGCLCCNVHIRNFEMGSPDHMNQCISFTGEVAEKTAEIILRELG